VGALTVLTAGSVAVVGASRLAVQQVAIRDQAALQLAHDQIVGRLSNVESLATQVSELIATKRDTTALDEEISPIVDASSGSVESVIIADRSGKVISAFPSELETSTPIDTPAFQSVLQAPLASGRSWRATSRGRCGCRGRCPRPRQAGGTSVSVDSFPSAC
jgi:hypothetical protein